LLHHSTVDSEPVPQREIFKALKLPDSGDEVVLFEYEAGSVADRNLLRVRTDGSVAWVAELPDPPGADAYVGAWLRPTHIEAQSFSGWHVWIDIDTGHIERSEFTK
jgi:hypothetical protein